MAKLTLNGAEALAEIKKLISEINQLKAASKTMSKATASNFTAIEASIINVKSKVGLLSNKLNYLNAIIKKQNSELSKNTTQLNKNSKAVDKLEKEVKQLTNENKKLSSSQKGVNLSFKNLIKGGFLLKAIELAKNLAADVYENIKTFDSLSFTLEKITKDSFNYENSQRFLLRITQAYGVELVTTTKRWSRFLAAAQESGLALRDAENIFESMTKASAALGLETDELTSVYLALEQMLSKGKVSTEELRRQLGERLPGAMGIMASSIGVTIPELDKMLKKGEILSAEVLPDFARAVERAYGIENAERIETLVAKQNRLTASWQTFIKNISEGDSVIKKVLGGFLDLLTKAADAYSYLFSDDAQKLRLDLSIEEGTIEKQLEESSKNFVERTGGLELEASLKFREDKLNDALKIAVGDERKVIEEGIDEIARIRAEKDKMSVERSKEIAREQIAVAYDQYKEAKKIYEQELEDQKQRDSEVKKPGQIDFNDYAGQIEEARKSLIIFEARYNIFRKLVDESDVKFIANDDDVTKTQKRLRDIKDYSIKIINEIAGYVSDYNLTLFEDDTLNIKERLNALKKSVQQQILISRNLLKQQEIDTEAKFKREVDETNKAVSKGTLSRQKANDFIKALEKEKNQFLVLQAQKTGNEIAQINIDAADKINKLSSSEFSSNKIGVVEDSFNKRIILAKKEFDQSRKTNEDRKRLESELAQAAIDSTNAIIDAKVELLRDEIRILELSGNANSEYIAKLNREINKLESNKQISPPIDTADWDRVLNESIDLAREFVGSVGDIFDAQFARKIENINAEIEAEEYKYDKLIALAEGDDEQQQTLERNKEDRIKKLEAKRLKQQQKQAKVNKAFAIAEIGINTARAIIGIWADFPKFDFGATAAIMSGVVGALGATQIAAVLSQPIPKYKDGVENLGSDQIAMINDGSFKEYIERNGRILSTDKKDAVVSLKKGDTVFKNYDDMASKSNLFKINASTSSQPLKNDKMLRDVTESIIDGFKKSKIDSTININQDSSDSSYRERMSMWN